MWLRISLFLVLACFQPGCAQKDPAVESLIGSEPQRLSFGPPPEVLHSFVEKMKVCWFTGPASPLAGYRYEAGEDSNGESYQNVKILDASGAGVAFEIQFHKYNDNTLIVTRNFSLAPNILNKIKRDIQLWALAGPECSS